MAFETRCPECKAKLRLDEAPAPGVPVECPRCGSQFDPPAAEAPARKPKEKKAGGGKEKSGKRKAKKKRTNPALLLIGIGFAFAGLIVVGFLMAWFLGRAGNVEEMLTYVPGECNWARGVNIGQLANYPGYANQVSRFNTPEVVAGTTQIAQAAGQDPDTFLQYLIIAKNRTGGGTGTMYVLRAKRAFKPADVGKGLGASEVSLGGDTGYRVGTSGAGILSGATVYMPTSKIVVVVPPGRMQNQLASGAAAGKASKKDSFAGQLDDTARLGIRGSIWLIIRANGGLKDYISGSLSGGVGNTNGGIDKDFPKLAERAATAKTLVVWTTPGGNGARLGIGIDCGTAKDAAELAKSFRDGPLGKGDESEPTNEMKKVVRFAADKRAFGEFMQFASFDNFGTCGVLRSKAEADNAGKMMDIFNSPSMGTDGN